MEAWSVREDIEGTQIRVGIPTYYHPSLTSLLGPARVRMEYTFPWFEQQVSGFWMRLRYERLPSSVKPRVGNIINK